LFGVVEEEVTRHMLWEVITELLASKGGGILIKEEL
jgi:hypothetical protein